MIPFLRNDFYLSCLYPLIVIQISVNRLNLSRSIVPSERSSSNISTWLLIWRPIRSSKSFFAYFLNHPII
ncbi:hypothetical protein B9T54_05510 [Leptospira borgpetersenii serovar Hardjo-bovis]|nr:hypothetical protein B9T54_05510 [Leptospira borgpetersenii serovar Hardjo-bovis]